MRKSRILCLCLALVMLLSIFPLSVSAEQVDTIAVGDTKDVVIDANNLKVPFYFTPTKTGYYAFWSSDSDMDTYGYVYNGEDEVNKNDDGGANNQFEVHVELTAGVQYTLVAGTYNDSYFGTMKVHLTEMAPPTGMECFDGKSAIALNIGAEYYDEPLFSPEGSFNMSVVYSSSNPQVVGVFDHGFYAIAAGTATVTATSSNGLKDTIKVTVTSPITIKLGQKDEVSPYNPIANTYKFVAPADGEYTVITRKGESVEFYIYKLTDGGLEYIANSDYFGEDLYAGFSAAKNDVFYVTFEHRPSGGNYVVSVEKKVQNKGFQIDMEKYFGYVNDGIYPNIAPKPLNSYLDNWNITYTSSDPAVVEDDGSGELRCKGVGTATVTATNEDGFSTTFEVTVMEPQTIIKEGKQSFKANKGQYNYMFRFTPATTGEYYLYETSNITIYSYDMPSYGDNVYELTADEEYIIYVDAYQKPDQIEFVLCKKGTYACHTKGHQMVTRRGFGATTLTMGVMEKECKICGVLGFDFAEKLTAKKDASKQFKDIKTKNWFYESVNFAYSSNLFNGTDTNVFSPEDTMTRGMFVTVLGRMSGVAADKTATTKFKDVAKGQYYTSYVKWASDAGIVNGITATTFEPESDITREQICVMMVRYMKFNSLGLRNDTPALKFKDQAKISSWAKDAVAACQRGSIVNGSEDGNGYVFNPQGNATRAEVATIIHNYTKNYLEMIFGGYMMGA